MAGAANRSGQAEADRRPGVARLADPQNRPHRPQIRRWAASSAREPLAGCPGIALRPSWAVLRENESPDIGA